MKRLVDLILLVVALIFLSIPMLIVAIIVKLTSPGPIVFWSDRVGQYNRIFRMPKFRTMQVNTPNVATHLLVGAGNYLTPVGGFLRKSSLDELPQLFNVLKGEMSLVGPRPHAVEHNELYRRQIPGYMQRHSFKPGITGLAQIEGWRGETNSLQSMVQRIEADLRYARDWSLKLDIKILLKTMLRLRSPNAY